ncbi:MAG: glutathione S-transferase family protein [Planctomycetes bacterium]|nr:glutathione S-transferase family protein [Planctomycetota bacterium]
MSADVVVYGFETSNNVKVRIALAYKGVPFEFRTIDPGDRETVVRISGQHLTPVLVHGDRVVHDSAAILRYLDTTFGEGPKLFGTGRDEQWAIEDLELMARWALAGPMMAVIHRRVRGENVPDEELAVCQEAFARAAAKYAERLAGRSWLVGDSMTAADITAAAVFWRVRGAGLFELGELEGAIQPWVDRVIAFDPGPNG